MDYLAGGGGMLAPSKLLGRGAAPRPDPMPKCFISIVIIDRKILSYYLCLS